MGKNPVEGATTQEWEGEKEEGVKRRPQQVRGRKKHPCW